MDIKSLLPGSAAALAAVSGAQAADAIIAAEPEPMEYVRVCDAFGTGFFYIPGTETCLRIGGEVRVAVNFFEQDDEDFSWESENRVRLAFDARNDTELGALTSYIQFEAQSFGSESDDVQVRQAYIDLNGFRAGRTLNWWDDDIAGEADSSSTNAIFNTLRYTYVSDAFTVGLGLDDFSNFYGDTRNDIDQGQLGVSGVVQASLGSASLQAVGGYDFEAEAGAVRGIVTADIGPGSLGLMGVWASDPNVYYEESEWQVAVSYAVKATEKLTITPAVAYYDNVLFSDADLWAASLTAEYQVVSGLNVAANIGYATVDGGADDEDAFNGFVRLIRTF